MENKVLETEKGKKIEEVNATENKESEKVTEKVTEKIEETVNTMESAPQTNSQPLLMVEVVNITHEKFRQTEEIKV